MSYTFVTVAHREDSAWMQLQAASLARYLPRDRVASILVVDNSKPGSSAEWDQVLPPHLDGLAPRLRVVNAGDLATIPSSVSGWRSQQALKLLAARLVETECYVVLDAKNHLVFTLEAAFLAVGPKMRSRLMNFEQHPMRAYLEDTLRYFGLEPAAHIPRFTPVVTPFVLSTGETRRLLAAVGARTAMSFEDAFFSYRLNEFFLVSTYLLASGRRIEDLYDLSGVASPTVWSQNAAAGTAEVLRLIDHSERHQLPFFAVHRRAVPLLTAESRELIADFWARRSLFATRDEGLAFIAVQSARPNGG